MALQHQTVCENIALLVACAVPMFLSCVVLLPIITGDALSPTVNGGRDLYIASGVIDLLVMAPLLVVVCRRMITNHRNSLSRNMSAAGHSRSSSSQLSEESFDSQALDIVFVANGARSLSEI
jgi:hypothetical protein